MKNKLRIKTFCSSLALLLAATLGVQRANAQQPQQPNEAPQHNVGDDPIRELNLTPEQRAQIRAIRQENQEERASINQRLREANRSLQAALDLDSPDEATVEQLLSQVTTLQAAQMRMRVLSEVRIRRVLTPAQRAVLRELRLARQQLRRDLQTPRRNGLTPRNRRNGLRPVAPRIRP